MRRIQNPAILNASLQKLEGEDVQSALPLGTERDDFVPLEVLERRRVVNDLVLGELPRDDARLGVCGGRRRRSGSEAERRVDDVVLRVGAECADPLFFLSLVSSCEAACGSA